MTRRALFKALAGLPLLQLVEPLVRRWRPAPVVFQPLQRVIIGAEAGRLAFGEEWRGALWCEIPNRPEQPEPLAILNPTTRVLVEGGPVIWEERR